MNSRFETTKKAILREDIVKNLESLSERIDVMYLVGGKFTDDEYIELNDMVLNRIASFTNNDQTDTYKEKMKDESV